MMVIRIARTFRHFDVGVLTPPMRLRGKKIHT
jgi:hypothetical protein